MRSRYKKDDACCGQSVVPSSFALYASHPLDEGFYFPYEWRSIHLPRKVQFISFEVIFIFFGTEFSESSFDSLTGNRSIMKVRLHPFD